MRCPFCGSNIEKDDKYCNNCGTAVNSEFEEEKLDNIGNTAFGYEQNEVITPEHETENEPEYEEKNTFIPDTPHTHYISKGGPSDKLPIILTAVVIITFIAVFSIGFIFGVKDNKAKQPVPADNHSVSSFEQDSKNLLSDYSLGVYKYGVYENYWLGISFEVPVEFKKRMNDYEYRYEYEYEEKIIPDAEIGFYAETDDGETVKIAFEKTEEDAENYGISYAGCIQGEMTRGDFSDSKIVDGGTVSATENLSFFRKDVIVKNNDGSEIDFGVFTCKKDGYICSICIRANSAEKVDELFNLFKEA